MDWRIPLDAVGMRASHAVNDNLLSRNITQPFHFMCKIGDIFSSNTVRTKNCKKTYALHRHMRSSAVHCQVFCAHIRRLAPLSMTNGLGARERRRTKNRFFRKTHFGNKNIFAYEVTEIPLARLRNVPSHAPWCK
jgi:hypothetical protein